MCKCCSRGTDGESLEMVAETHACLIGWCDVMWQLGSSRGAGRAVLKAGWWCLPIQQMIPDCRVQAETRPHIFPGRVRTWLLKRKKKNTPPNPNQNTGLNLCQFIMVTSIQMLLVSAELAWVSLQRYRCRGFSTPVEMLWGHLHKVWAQVFMGNRPSMNQDCRWAGGRVWDQLMVGCCIQISGSTLVIRSSSFRWPLQKEPNNT